MTNDRIQELQHTIQPLRLEILNHPVYKKIEDLDQLRSFMEHHIYAVWDFMSLLKALQNALTCTSVPWRPVGNANTRYLINEIVTGEESDVDEFGNRKSHFELYLDAMRQAGADSSVAEKFVDDYCSGQSFSASAHSVPQAAREFMEFTFDIIQSGKPHVMSAVFTFGREDLIPDMFIEMVRDFSQSFPKEVSTLLYYLERHIEVDGDHHSHLALEMTAVLCGDDSEKWNEALEAVKKALVMRRTLWDGVFAAIQTEHA